MIDYKTPRFKTSLVAEAAGISHATMRSYFKRGQWRVIGKPAEGEGLPNLFSLRDAMAFAVAARLCEATNATPDEAFNIAVLDFAHIGDKERTPGTLYDVNKRGNTFLIYWPDIRKARIEHENDVQKHGLSRLLPGFAGQRDAATIITLNPIERRVFGVLGVAGNSWENTLGGTVDDDSGEFIG